MSTPTYFKGGFQLTPNLTKEQCAILNEFQKDDRDDEIEFESQVQSSLIVTPDKIVWDGIDDHSFNTPLWVEYFIKKYLMAWNVLATGILFKQDDYELEANSITIVYKNRFQEIYFPMLRILNVPSSIDLTKVKGYEDFNNPIPIITTFQIDLSLYKYPYE